ncbi:hypothetical protein F5887DRAFT_12594 [Amanita rubescens]|nr:hypothetical protein F5887DRAFT_12594 [Amanita rubescens]
MFGLIRRLSHSVIPRSDRPWEDDPTSNAPHKPRKRRLSTSEQDDASSDRHESVGKEGYVGESAAKRARAEGAPTSSDADEFGTWSAMPQQEEIRTSPEPDQTSTEPATEPQVETQDLKEVTKGVKEVELEDKEEEEPTATDVVEPETVPLPDEDEVDELDSDDDSSSADSGSDHQEQPEE